MNLERHRVLIIDAAMQAVSVVTLKKAFTKLCAGRARAVRDRGFRAPEVIVYSKDGAVIGVDGGTRVPSVIQLGSVVPRWKQRVRFCRKNVIVGRDRCICAYCGERYHTEDLTIDHVRPRAQGGTTCWENVVTACMACNQRKADRTPEQAQMRLGYRPSRPNSLVEVIVKMDLREVPTEWSDYWSVPLER
jgi:5-methylcytosine-specific restriction endonuclease McrA